MILSRSQVAMMSRLHHFFYCRHTSLHSEKSTFSKARNRLIRTVKKSLFSIGENPSFPWSPIWGFVTANIATFYSSKMAFLYGQKIETFYRRKLLLLIVANWTFLPISLNTTLHSIIKIFYHRKRIYRPANTTMEYRLLMSQRNRRNIATCKPAILMEYSYLLASDTVGFGSI